jgi:cell division GTPase FtsZ
MKHGFIGVGQGGNNIIDAGFAKTFPVLAVNTAEVDLGNLKNVTKDCQFVARITEGGAGENIIIGEQAVRMHRKEIAEKIKTIFRECEYIWVVTGLGGGTGTLASVQIIEILTEMGINHGFIGTMPMKNEGTTKKVNAVLGMNQIWTAHTQSELFKSMVIIDNERLKNIIIQEGEFSHEKLWETVNDRIFSMFSALYDFTEQSGTTCLDLEDFKRMFDQKGCMLFNEGDYDPRNQSNQGLAICIMELWRDTIFQTGDIEGALATAVVLERPADFDKDGQLIDNMFAALKDKFKAGLFCRGVYASKLNTADILKIRKKPVRVLTVVSGAPFPKEYLQKFTQEADEELKIIYDKAKPENDLGIGNMLGVFRDYVVKNNGPKQGQKLDLSLFNNDAAATKDIKFKL